MIILNNNHYQLLEKTYESDNSLVYRAATIPYDRPIILKILKENYPTPLEVNRYQQEYKIACSFNEESIIKAYDLQRYKNTLVMVLEDFGPRFFKLLLSQSQLNLEDFINIAIKITEGLATIHQANVIHRNINPSNIIYNFQTKQLKIIDFGISTCLSKEFTTIISPNQLKGTLAYISPEKTGIINRAIDYSIAYLATLTLIERLLVTGTTKYILLLGAGRDNEVSINHTLAIFLKKLKSNQAEINQINLKKLPIYKIACLISDTLKQNREKICDLASLVMAKTAGHLLFVNNFFEVLYMEELLDSNHRLRVWQYDIEGINDRTFTENVVELMASQLQKLPKLSRDVLSIAACLGAEFDLQTLTWAETKSAKEIFYSLQICLNYNLILPKSKSDENLLIQSFKFSNDPIQQAAYALIPDNKKNKTHYHIGKLLLQNMPPETKEENIFELVNQLNYGITLITEQTEAEELAQLNLLACRKARAANAYQTAREYTNIGLALLGENAWSQQYDITLEFYELGIELAALSDDFEVMEQFTEIVIANTRSLSEKMNVYRIEIQSYNGRNLGTEAIDIAKQFLEQLGVSFPEIPTQNDVQQALSEIEILMSDQEIEKLVDLPTMKDTAKIPIVKIANSIMSATYLSGYLFFYLLVALLAKLSIRYGNAEASAFAYSCYGLIACNRLQNPNLGVKFGKLALQIVFKLDLKTLKPLVMLVVALFILHYKSHIKETISPLQESYGISLEVGNLEFAGYNAYGFCLQSFWCSQSLASLERAAYTYFNELVKLNQSLAANWCRSCWQSTLNLLGIAKYPTILSQNVDQEAEFISQMVSADDFLGLSSFYLYKMMLCYLFEEIEFIQNYVAEIRKYVLVASSGLIIQPVFYFYDSLIALASLSEAKNEMSEVLQRVAENQKQLQQQWAESAPMNYQHKVDLVEAEKWRILGNKEEAIELYERAISGAKENKYLQEEALANELAAKFYIDWDKKKLASIHMIEAHDCYSQWGAIAKVKQLESEYSQYLLGVMDKPKSTGVSRTTSITENDGEVLDLTTIIKASQAISREIKLEKLLKNLMKIVIETVGAQKGFLILKNEDNWVLEAQGNIDNEEVIILPSIPIESKEHDNFTPILPNSIINYVIHTQEYVVLNKAVSEGQFINDSYIKANKSKSILCTPLVNQGQLRGIIYLENNLTTGVFTSKRVELLNILSAQAAISIDNSKLYSQVMEKERRFAQFLDALPVGVAIIDASGHPHYFNQVAKELLGKEVISDLTSEQIASTYQLYKISTNQEYPSYELPMIRALQGESLTTEDVYVRKGDQVIPLEIFSSPVYDQQGKIIYAINSFIDITERKKAEVAHKRFTNELFQLNMAYERFVPRQFLEFLDKKTILDVELGDQVQLEMSILFSDVRNFTTISEAMTPEENFYFINSFLSRMEPAILENQGFIDKYIGDSIMALFSGDADNAVKAGISMLRRLNQYNQDRANSAPINISIGINTGLLMLGTVGGTNRMDGTVISDAVNLASRVERLTKNYGVSLLITQQTFARLTQVQDYAIRSIDTVQVKGKSQKVTIYEVFDADPPVVKEGKLNTLQQFKEAILLYKSGKSLASRGLFAECLKLNPNDQVAQIYLQRILTQDLFSRGEE